jgi:hypothetical protein
MADLFSFPNPVNEKAARTVAGVVMATAIVTLATGAYWLLVPLAYGFIARVLTGPTLSPLGQLATRFVTPRLGVAPRPVPGPPKRFAQGIGAVLSVAAATLAVGFGQQGAADLALAAILVAASLEAFLGFCLGCKIFAWLMRIGVIPESVCEACLSVRFDSPPEGDPAR